MWELLTTPIDAYNSISGVFCSNDNRLLYPSCACARGVISTGVEDERHHKCPHAHDRMTIRIVQWLAPTQHAASNPTVHVAGDSAEFYLDVNTATIIIVYIYMSSYIIPSCASPRINHWSLLFQRVMLRGSQITSNYKSR